MKRSILIVFFLVPFSLIAQAWWEIYPYITSINFDNSTNLQYLTIDIVSNPNNIWQIGVPQKTYFTSAYSIPNVIVTDTINSYPTNDTSSFILIHEFVTGSDEFYLEGFYYCDTDSLNDFGKIEISPDNGNSWILISSDTSTYLGSDGTSFNWPIITNLNLTGNSNGWQYFKIDMNNSLAVFNSSFGDTILFKFTFISDGTAELSDGLMFDNILLFDVFVFGIEEQSDISVKIFPNPVQTEINFEGASFENSVVYIYSLDGKEILRKTITDENIIDVSELATGTYIVKVILETGVYSMQIYKE